MKILNAEQIRALDAYTIANEPIGSLDLMERAAGKCFEWICRHVDRGRPIKVFCGMGNNGGDGLVLARLLAEAGYFVVVYIISHTDNPTADFLANEERLRERDLVKIEVITDAVELPGLNSGDMVVDAMLGSGLTRPLDGLLALIVKHINATASEVVAIDLPTGLFCDNNKNNTPHHIILADHTLSFQFPKLAFMLSSNEKFSGRWQVLDIGLHPQGIRETETKYHYLLSEDIRPIYKPRKKFAHKGHFGHAYLMAGSYGKVGAAVLASRAVLTAGAGLLTVQLPGCGYAVLQVAVPEAMCVPDEHPHIISGVTSLEGFNVVGVGPGMGTNEQSAKALKLLIQNAEVPMVLDADALNILSENPTWCGFLPKGSVFTPHPGEMDRIAGKTTDDLDRLEKAKEIAHRFQVHIVLKGAHTVVVCPDGRCFFNSTGNPGMATGGSGDVLTGIIVGWLAQNYSPLASCLLGVYLHGLAGDLAAKEKGYEGLIASDIIAHLPMAIKRAFLS